MCRKVYQLQASFTWAECRTGRDPARVSALEKFYRRSPGSHMPSVTPPAGPSSAKAPVAPDLANVICTYGISRCDMHRVQTTLGPVRAITYNWACFAARLSPIQCNRRTTTIVSAMLRWRCSWQDCCWLRNGLARCTGLSTAASFKRHMFPPKPLWTCYPLFPTGRLH